MNLIKCRFLKDNQPTGKPYTYDSPVAVKPGDIVQINSSATGVVVEVNVPEEEVEAFRDKVKSIVGLAESRSKRWEIVDIQDSSTKETRADGRYPLRIGRICKKPEPVVTEPFVLEYIANADGSDYSNRFLRTSRVVNVFERGGLMEIETMNSIYVFKKVGEQL